MKIPTIPHNALVDIQISGDYFAKIQLTLLWLIDQLNKEEYQECVSLIQANTSSKKLHDKKPIYLHIKTLLILVQDLTKTAESSGLLIEEDIIIE